jgi:TRAP-type mannitol/chloroaromatic compound transport system permease large subunit
MGLTWHALTKPNVVEDTSALLQMGEGTASTDSTVSTASGVAEPSEAEEAKSTSTGLAEPPDEPATGGTGVAEPPAEPATGGTGVAEPPAEAPKAPGPATAVAPPAAAPGAAAAKAERARVAGAEWHRLPAPNAFWIVLAIGTAALAVFYAVFTFVRLEIFKMLLSSFFPLAVMILAVLGSIVFGLATPTEAAAVGSFGGFVLAAVYSLLAKPPERARSIFRTWLPLWLLTAVSVVWFGLFKFEVLEAGPPLWVGWVSIGAAALWCVIAVFQVDLGSTVKESVFLTAKTSAMVCWLFVGSSIFSAAFALLGGQELVERWVLSLGLTPIQFLILAQIIIFLLGWPLEWTEIIVIFMPIFIPLLAKFNIDPLFFGLLVALNLQTAFLSPPVAMAAFYLKGVSPKHVTLNQIFAGMLPFMGIQVVALALLYIWPQIGLWLPNLLYAR